MKRAFRLWALATRKLRATRKAELLLQSASNRGTMAGAFHAWAAVAQVDGPTRRRQAAAIAAHRRAQVGRYMAAWQREAQLGKTAEAFRHLALLRRAFEAFLALGRQRSAALRHRARAEAERASLLELERAAATRRERSRILAGEVPFGGEGGPGLRYAPRVGTWAPAEGESGREGALGAAMDRWETTAAYHRDRGRAERKAEALAFGKDWPHIAAVPPFLTDGRALPESYWFAPGPGGYDALVPGPFAEQPPLAAFGVAPSTRRAAAGLRRDAGQAATTTGRGCCERF